MRPHAFGRIRRIAKVVGGFVGGAFGYMLVSWPLLSKGLGCSLFVARERDQDRDLRATATFRFDRKFAPMQAGEGLCDG